MIDSLTPKRSRGGQPGNINALQHGFYSTRFKAAENHDLETCQGLDLSDEITMLRVYIRRVLEVNTNLADPDTAISLLRALGQATTSLTRLVRTQNTIKGGKNEVMNALNIALEDVCKDIKCAQPHP